MNKKIIKEISQYIDTLLSFQQFVRFLSSGSEIFSLAYASLFKAEFTYIHLNILKIVSQMIG